MHISLQNLLGFSATKFFQERKAMRRHIAPALQKVLLLITGVVMVSTMAFSQATTGDIAGSVVDQTGRVITNAKVIATRLDTNQTFATTTNDSGEFRFTSLHVGMYNVNTTEPGFNAAVLKNLPVELNKTGSARIKMEEGEVSITVEVS